VEKHLLAALEKSKLIKDREWARYSRCGRTDKGVSALRQVVGVRVRSSRLQSQGEKQEGGGGREEGGGGGVVEAGREEERGGDEDTIEVGSSSGGGGKEMQVGRVTGEVEDAVVEGEMDYCMVLNRVLPSDIRVMGWAPTPTAFSARFCCSYRTYRYFFDAGEVGD